MSRKLAGLLSAGLMTAGVAVFALPASASAPYWEIMTIPEGLGGPTLCLEGDPDPTGPHATKVVQTFCSGLANQQWLPVNQGGDVFKFVNEASGLCLDTYVKGSPVNHAPVIEWDCSANISNTRWAWPLPTNPGEDTFPGIHPLQTRVSNSTGFCLDVPNSAATVGLQMQIFGCNGSFAQEIFISRPG